MNRKFTKPFFFVLLLSQLLLTSLQSQTPQYYNPSLAPVGNSLPFGSALGAQGYMCQWLIGPGEYSLPSSAPPGDITKLYIYMSSNGGGTYTNLTIRMGQTALTSFSGVYSGVLDTVYFRASVSLSSTMNAWLVFTLDTVFNYNPAQSLVIVISQCGISGTGMNVWQNTGTTGIFRRNPMAGTPSCVFTYSASDTRVLQNGIDINPPVGIGNNNEVPKVYSLGQNYPNPFNPMTNISFEIPNSGYVDLRVYNTLGMEVAILENSFMTAGRYEKVFDASSLASGVYYYTIRVNEFTETKKMLLVK